MLAASLFAQVVLTAGLSAGLEPESGWLVVLVSCGDSGLLTSATDQDRCRLTEASSALSVGCRSWVIAVTAPRRWLELPLNAADAGEVDADEVLVPYPPHSEVHFDVRASCPWKGSATTRHRQPRLM